MPSSRDAYSTAPIDFAPLEELREGGRVGRFLPAMVRKEVKVTKVMQVMQVMNTLYLI
jgi:hypothetical protein